MVAALPAPKVTRFRAMLPTEDTSSKIVLAHVALSLAAPIPQSTQPWGGVPQQTGPTPLKVGPHLSQQRPASYTLLLPHSAVLGLPTMIVLAQERSNPPLKPRALQFGACAGLQMQQATLVQPGLHLGYTIRPVSSQFPLPQSRSHLWNISSESKESPNSQGYPAPLGYSAILQNSPSSLHPEGQFWWQSKTKRLYPVGHASQHRSPILTVPLGHSDGIVPTPLPQLSFQQNSDSDSWFLRVIAEARPNNTRTNRRAFWACISQLLYGNS